MHPDRLSVPLALLAAGLLGSGAPALAQAKATPEPTAVIVFDSSGSMWGEIGSERGPKFERTREALRTAFSAQKAARSGLIVFGPSCTTADLAVPPGLHPVDVLLRPLDRLNPKSKGPVALGLKRALELFEKGVSGGIILVHDGADNCGEDMCAVAREIAAQRPGIGVHLISLGLTEADRKATTCLAELTGGRVFPVATVADLAPAVEGAVKLALKIDPKRVPEPEPGAAKPTKAAEPKAPAVDPLGPPHLVARAFLGEADTVLGLPIRWRIYKGEDVAKPVLDISEPQFSVPLPAGSYVVEAAAGLVSARVGVNVAENGPTRADVRFEAGELALTSKRTRQEASRLPVLVTVSRLGTAAQASSAGEPVAISPALPATLILPIGRYLVTTERGLEKQSQTIEIAKGQTHALDATLTSGELSVAAVSAQGALLADALVILSRDDPDAPGGRREVARSGGGQSTFLLPAGIYYVGVRSGTAEILEQVAVGAGERIERTVKLGVARLSVRVTTTHESRNTDLPVSYRILDLQRDRVEVASSQMPTATFSLPAGIYRIVALIGGRNAVAERDVKLEAGAVADVAFEAKTSELRLGLVRDPGVFVSDRFWQISDAGGAVVWRTSHQSPVALLAPGSYLVRCETAGKVLEKNVVLIAGGKHTVEFEP